MLLTRFLRPSLALAAITALIGASAQGTLTVEVAVPHGAEGVLRVAACPDAAAFTTDKGCIQRKVEAVRPVTTVRIAEVPAGRCAVKAFLDTDGDGTLDLTPGGLPAEPFGISRDVLGKPSEALFERAAVEVPAAGAVVRFRLRDRTAVRGGR